MGCHQHCASQDVMLPAGVLSSPGVACTAIVPGGRPCAIVGPGFGRGCPVHAHGDRGGAAGRLPVRCRDRAGWRGHCARAQPRTHHQRSDRARRDGRDPAVPGGSWSSRVERQHALHVGRILRDVHGRDPLVSHGTAGFCRVDCATRHQDRPDHADRCRDCREGARSPRSQSPAACSPTRRWLCSRSK